MKEELYQKIEAYLGGNMSPEVAAEFEVEMERDAALRKEVELYGHLNHHLGGVHEDRRAEDSQYADDIRVFLKSEEAQVLEQKLREGQKGYEEKTNSRYTAYKYAAAIVAFIVVLGAWMLFFRDVDTPKTLYTEYYRTADLPSFVKRNDAEDMIFPIVNHFKNENYTKTLTAFAKYKETVITVDTTLYLYVGMSHLALEEDEKALTSFDLVVNSGLLDHSKGLWFKALAYLKMENRVNTRKILNEIVENPANFKFREAKELLEKL